MQSAFLEEKQTNQNKTEKKQLTAKQCFNVNVEIHT